MLVTDDFTLKLAGFGEVRAADLGHTMTTVGTPIYIAPEIMRNDKYNSKVDVYSFGVCLLAMARADRIVVSFFLESLRKSMRGLGINNLNMKMQRTDWKP